MIIIFYPKFQISGAEPVQHVLIADEGNVQENESRSPDWEKPRSRGRPGC